MIDRVDLVLFDELAKPAGPLARLGECQVVIGSEPHLSSSAFEHEPEDPALRPAFAHP
jgi:hypothetical protein